MECVLIDTARALREHYWLLDEACERLTQREGRLHFAPDVYGALMRGEAQMLLVVDREPVGMVVVYSSETPAKEPALHVWLAYARPGASSEVVATGLRECELRAAEQGKTHLMFATQRRGWFRAAAKLGYELAEMTYTKKVTL